MRALLLIAILALATPAHATIVCNGDSNTQSNWQGYPNGTSDGWCERIGGINRGVGGSTISDHAYSFHDLPLGVFMPDMPLWGGYYIDAELAGADPFATWATGTPPKLLGQATLSPLPQPDIVILAFGTNDVRADWLGGPWTPNQIIHFYKKYRQRAIATGATVYIATTPPIYNTDGTLSAYDATIRSLNAKIRGNWPSKYIEFYDGFTVADFQLDGLHLNASGQAKRAAAAAAVIP